MFEELSEANFNRSYIDEQLITVETDAIKLYLQTHELKHIPVDTYRRPERLLGEMGLVEIALRILRSTLILIRFLH